MNRDRNSFIICFSFLIFILSPAAFFPQLGMTCPPCNAEKKHYENAKRILEEIKVDLSAARNEMNRKAAATGRAQTQFSNTLRRANQICLNAPGSDNCKQAKELVNIAFLRLEKRSREAENAIREVDRIILRLNEAQEYMNLMKTKWNQCESRIMPGPCLKCENGHVVIYDDDIVGICEKCKNGKLINKEWEKPGTCRHCVNMELVDKCKSNEQCCWGSVCQLIRDLYWVTVTVITCTDVEVNEFWSEICHPGESGEIERSRGRCEGAITRIECSGPYQPCYPEN